MPETLKISPNQSLEIHTSTPDLFEVRTTYGPAGPEPPKHFHPDQDEHFEVLAGAVRVRVDEEEHDLAEGEEIEIPRRAVHQMWNPHAEPARVLWQTRPGGRTEQWFRAVDALLREAAEAGRDGPEPSAFVALLNEYDDVFRLASDQ
jgi:quercetin dioxygenase-like cupin family protein